MNQYKITNLNINDSFILSQFHERRTIFDIYIKERKISVVTCPSCGYPTLKRRGAYEICGICKWEDDGQDDEDANEIRGGPNSNLSLNESRLNIGRKIFILSKKTNGNINLDPNQILEYLNINKSNKKITGEKLLIRLFKNMH